MQNKPTEKFPIKPVSKKLGYRTPDRFKRSVFRRNPALIVRTRSFGGHQ